ncbi:hypothetical protein Tco_0729257 [Tanacetum coccineum]|uniref:Reverse transcriptase domain-containing protein n=1 Tax=Tanacetum coccineum TaxID=301880 RepID=A0ABQ4YPN0_9ASTR
MAQLLEAPTEGYEDAIVVPEITANNFEIKHGLLNLVQNKQFFGHDKEDPHAHFEISNKITSTLKFPNIRVREFIQLDTFYNSLNSNDQDSLKKAPLCGWEYRALPPQTVSSDVAELKDMPVEILEREFKKLKHSRIAIFKVWWNSKHSPEFTWECDDQMKLKNPLLFSDVSG